MVPSFLYNVGSGILRAVGDTKRPLYFLIIACLTNIVLDVLFVVGFGMGVLGVATATVISQVVSCVLVMLMLMRSTSVFSVHRSEIGFTDYSTRRVLRVGLPAALQSNMFTIANIIIQSCINSFGTDTVAAWTAYGKVDGLFWMIMGALGISVTTFVGQNFGAQKYRRVRRSVRIGLLMGFAIAGLCSAVLLTFAHTLLSWFTTSETVLSIGMRTVQLTIPFYFTYVSVEVLSGAVRGTGDSFWPMIISASGICLLRMLWVFLVVPMFPGFDTIVMIFPISWGATSLIFAAYYLQGGWLRPAYLHHGLCPRGPEQSRSGLSIKTKDRRKIPAVFCCWGQTVCSEPAGTRAAMTQPMRSSGDSSGASTVTSRSGPPPGFGNSSEVISPGSQGVSSSHRRKSAGRAGLSEAAISSRLWGEISSVRRLAARIP